MHADESEHSYRMKSFRLLFFVHFNVIFSHLFSFKYQKSEMELPVVHVRSCV